jgi:hypothetical protein
MRSVPGPRAVTVRMLSAADEYIRRRCSFSRAKTSANITPEAWSPPHCVRVMKPQL